MSSQEFSSPNRHFVVATNSCRCQKNFRDDDCCDIRALWKYLLGELICFKVPQFNPLDRGLIELDFCHQTVCKLTKNNRLRREEGKRDQGSRSKHKYTEVVRLFSSR